MANKIKLELREEEIQNLIFSCNKSLAFLRAIRLDLGEKATKKIICKSTNWITEKRGL